MSASPFSGGLRRTIATEGQIFLPSVPNTATRITPGSQRCRPEVTTAKARRTNPRYTIQATSGLWVLRVYVGLRALMNEGP